MNKATALKTLQAGLLAIAVLLFSSLPTIFVQASAVIQFDKVAVTKARYTPGQ